MGNSIALFITMFFSLSRADASILPKNNLHLQDHPSLVSNVSKSDFNRVIDRAEKYYGPIIDHKHWGDLIINRYWQGSTVNATAQRDEDDWIVNMYGGLARRPEITLDSFTLVLCHELGHHLAGFPFVSSWAANEGQSDYFAAHSCARMFWKEEKQDNASYRNSAHPAAKAKCDYSYPTIEEQNLCYRISAAGQSLANLVALISNNQSPSYDTPDTKIIHRTTNYHPEAQCRLDTYLAAALCPTTFDDMKIPGLYRNRKEAEIEAIQNSCSQFNLEHIYSMKPKCWYKQKVGENNTN